MLAGSAHFLLDRRSRVTMWRYRTLFCSRFPGSLLLLILGLQGCGPRGVPAAGLQTRITLGDTLVASGDTIIATVVVINRGKTSMSLRVPCDPLLSAELENEDGNCVAGCEAPCPPSAVPVELVLTPGDSVTRTFQYVHLPWGNFPMPFPPGPYAVHGGVQQCRGNIPWARTQLVVTVAE
jgi:hypothetical protein